MQLIDTHCHIHEAQFELTGDSNTRALWLRNNKLDPDDMIKHAAKQDVTTMICVGTTAEDSRLAIEFVQTRPACFASIGLHPHEAKYFKESASILRGLLANPEAHVLRQPRVARKEGTPPARSRYSGEDWWGVALSDEALGVAKSETATPRVLPLRAPSHSYSPGVPDSVRMGYPPSGSPEASQGMQPKDWQAGSVARSKKIVAIGECGLDYFYNHSDKKDQQAALRFQIELALEHDLPMTFHVREAFDDFWPIFDSYKGIRGVLHSFTDSRQNLDRAMERGLYIGANGIMTFTKDQAQLEVAKAIPLQKLLLETDAPFLTPAPFRGRVNEPAHVRLVADFMAHLRGEPLAELANQTSANAQTLFHLK